ncbi:MAG: SIR2 family protein [Candidatus Krumholzibacteriota bacterium]|nr:SIR2 family protein [Candidatus Krumholzibacteriota bacterium]
MHFVESKNIYDIYREIKSPINLFVGAGISVPEPSCLPLTLGIAKSILRMDWFGGDERFPVEDDNLIQRIAKKVRMEHLLSIYHKWRGHDPGNLITQFGEARPNYYHKKIAQLVKEEIVQRIFTTNFDLCLEKAFRDEEIPFQQIIDREDYLNPDKNKIQIVKLHGSVVLSEGKYFTKGLITTLESISREIPVWKASCLSKNIEENGLVCIGYSGNDSFDINPVLRAGRNSKIAWVFRRQPDPEDYREAIQTLEMSPKSQAIVSDIPTFLGEKQKLKMPENDFAFKPVVNLSERFHPSIVLGKILEESGEYEEAKEYYLNVITLSTGSNYWMVEILDLQRSWAVCYYETGDYDKTLELLSVGQMMLLDYKKRVSEKKGGILPAEKMLILEEELLYGEEFMVTYKMLNNMEKVQSMEKTLFKTLNELEKLSGPQTTHRSRLLFNSISVDFHLVETLGKTDFVEAKEYLENSLEMKKEIGDLIGTILVLGKLSIINLYLGDIPAAQDVLLKCIVTIRKANTYVATDFPQKIKSILSVVFFQHFTAGYCPVNTRVRWDTIDKKLMQKFENSLNDLLFNIPVENLDRKGFIEFIERESDLNHILRSIRNSVLRKDNLLKDEVDEFVRKYGISVITPDDKILQYRAVLEIMNPEDTNGYYATKYGQWEAIGSQYEKAGDYFQAAASYQNALDGAENMMIDIMFTQVVKDHGIEYLKQAIDRVSSKIGMSGM